MPLYTSRCHVCGGSMSYVRTVANRADTPDCCGEKTEKVLDAVAVGALTPKRLGFHMPDGKGPNGVGTWIEDGAAHAKYIKQNNLIPHSEASQEAKYQREQKDKAYKAAIREAVTKAADQILPS